MLTIWLGELRRSRLWATICALFSDQTHRQAVDHVYRWFYNDNPN